MNRAQKEQLLLLLQEKERRRQLDRSTVFGIVCPNEGLLKCVKRNGSQWKEVNDKPQIYIAKVLEPVLYTQKRFVVIYGGRGSGKSIQVVDIALAGVKDFADKVYCLREFQNSISESMHSTIKDEVDRIGLSGFEVLNNEINHGDGGFRFKGLARNPSSIKSAQGFRRFIVEEAQFISEESLTALTPTARNKAKAGLPEKFIVEKESDENKDIEALNSVQMIFIANPSSSEDPFSKRFLKPFEAELERKGWAEDDLHLIIRVNYDDNPWYADSGLEQERIYDYRNKPRALYDHIWLGKYNDSVDGSIILPEWFDACVDAHKRLGITPRGSKVFSFDPADTGPDAKGYAGRYGSVFFAAGEIDQPDINSSADEAAELAIGYGVDLFTWDCDGMGVGLQRQFSQWFQGKQIQVKQFRGSGSASDPDKPYQPPHESRGEVNYTAKIKTNKETFKNKRAQNYWNLRDRCYKTYRAVMFGEMSDPDDLISFSSNIKQLQKLRSEVCRIPKKHNSSGMIQMMSKEDMKKLGISSPNIADAVMMALEVPELHDDFDYYEERSQHNKTGSLGY